MGWIKIKYSILGLMALIWTFLLDLPLLRILRDLLYGVSAAGPPGEPIIPDGPWKHKFIQTNGIKLHYVCQGEEGKKPLMLMIHGFPEFWWSWRHQIPVFAKDYFVVAVDMRGYNLSDKPRERSAYHTTELVKDMEGVITGLGYRSAVVLAHDWGGMVAWQLAIHRPNLVDRLVIGNAPHPKCIMRELRSNEAQMSSSWYLYMFQLPLFPEWAISQKNYDQIRRMFIGKKTGARNTIAFSAADAEIFVQAAKRPGVLTAMLNYYRNIFSPRMTPAAQVKTKLQVPTLLLWGEDDTALTVSTTHGTDKFVEDLTIRFIPNCSHWVQQDAPSKVNVYIADWLIAQSKLH